MEMRQPVWYKFYLCSKLMQCNIPTFQHVCMEINRHQNRKEQKYKIGMHLNTCIRFYQILIIYLLQSYLLIKLENIFDYGKQ